MYPCKTPCGDIDCLDSCIHNKKSNKTCKCDLYYTCKACRRVDTYTYEQIGAMLGISHQAVCEIEKRAINKLRNNLYLLGYNSLEEIL